jgi:hypothetical protein
MRYWLVLLMICLLLPGSRGSAEGVSLDLDAQVLEVGLLGNLVPPGADSAGYYFDSASGIQARLQLYYVHVFLDYRHFYSSALDWMSAGVGHQLELPLSRSTVQFDVVCHLRTRLGFLMLGATGGGGEREAYTTEVGGHLGGSVAIEVGLTAWLVAGATFSAAGFWANSPGFELNIAGGFGLRL